MFSLQIKRKVGGLGFVFGIFLILGSSTTLFAGEGEGETDAVIAKKNAAALYTAILTRINTVGTEYNTHFSNAEAIAKGVVAHIRQVVLVQLSTPEKIKKVADRFEDTMRKTSNMPHETATQKKDKKAAAEVGKKQARRKVATPPRWIWSRKDWSKITRFAKKIKTVQGYTFTDVFDGKVQERTYFKDRTFYVYKTRDYIVTSDLNPKFTAELAVYMQKFVREFTKIFPIKPHGKILSKLVVVIFNDRQQYKKILFPDPSANWSRGVFLPKRYATGWPEFTVYSYFYDGGKTSYDRDPYYADDVKPKGTNQETNEGKRKREGRKGADAGEVPANFSNFPYAIIQHEATHAMLRRYVGMNTYQKQPNGVQKDKFPVFINEGCATYFENWDLRLSRKKNKAPGRIGHLCNRRYLVRNRLKNRNGKPFDLKAYIDLINVGTGLGHWAPDDGGPETAMNYAVAQTFGYFLINNKTGRRVFRKMMDKLYKGVPIDETKWISKISKKWNKCITEVILAGADGEGSG